MEPVTDGIFWNWVSSDTAPMLETPLNAPVNLAIKTSANRSSTYTNQDECVEPSLKSLLSSKVEFDRAPIAAEDARAIDIAAKDLASYVSVRQISNSVIKWQLDVGNLSRDHTGTWTVKIRTTVDLLTFELVILSGCKTNPSFKKNSYVWPTADYTWASINSQNSQSRSNLAFG